MCDLPGRSRRAVTDRSGRRWPRLPAAAAAGGPETGAYAQECLRTRTHTREGSPELHRPSPDRAGWEVRDGRDDR